MLFLAKFLFLKTLFLKNNNKDLALAIFSQWLEHQLGEWSQVRFRSGAWIVGSIQGP